MLYEFINQGVYIERQEARLKFTGILWTEILNLNFLDVFPLPPLPLMREFSGQLIHGSFSVRFGYFKQRNNKFTFRRSSYLRKTVTNWWNKASGECFCELYCFEEDKKCRLVFYRLYFFSSIPIRLTVSCRITFNHNF